MDFRILGPLQVLDGDRELMLGGPKQRALLAVLVIHANEALSTERLIDELWGERPPASAAKTVQVHVSRLRKALERSPQSAAAGPVVTREHGYELQTDRERVDTHRFERLIIEGREALIARQPARALSLLEDALSLWRGSPLGEFAYEPFARAEIDRLSDLRVTAVEELIDAKLALGRHAEVIGAIEPLIAEHPYRERPRAQLMLALYRCDRQADALQAYQDARHKLVEELGIEPGERLRELERAILAQDPTLAIPDRGEGAEPAPPAPRTAFVGRGQELVELVAGLDDAFAGRGRLFLLVGEPGIGKSRLAEELVAHARARGARILVGRCWEAGGAPAYWPWVQALRGYVRESDTAALRSQLGAGAADLAQIVPELSERFPDLPEPPSLESEGARFRLFDAIAVFLRNVSAAQPLVLVLDDLHAADTPSLLLLRFLARELGSTQILLLTAFRNVDPIPGLPLTEMLTEVAREPVTRRLLLDGLSANEVVQYVEQTASGIASSELVAALYEQTEGNPLFVSEIVRLLSIEGVPPVSTAGAQLAIPQSIRDVIARRLTYLSQQCNRLLVLASVIGREFGLQMLARVGRVSENELLDVLDEAMTARVLSEVPGASGRLRFAHVLIRDTLYEGLTPVRRVRMHRLVVETLESLYPEEPGPHVAELAHHSIAGSEFDKGLRYAWRAGDWALSLLAYEESARLYQTALDALDRSDAQDSTARCELLLALGEAQARAGNGPAAKAVFTNAADLARRAGLARELARAAAGYGGRIVWARAGKDDRLVPLLEEGLAALDDEDVELRTRLLARLAGALRDEPSLERRNAVSHEAVELARRRGTPAALAYALNGRAAAIYAPGTQVEHLALATELREIAGRIGDGERLQSAHYQRCMAQLVIGKVPEAEADLVASTRIAEELRQPAQLWQVLAGRAMLAIATGRFSEAEELVAEALALGERAQQGMAIPAYTMHRYALSEFQGRLQGEAAIRDAIVDYPARTVFRCVLAHFTARLGRLPEAKRMLDELADHESSALPFDSEWLYAMSLLAEVSAALRDTQSATVLYPMLAPYSELNVVDMPDGVRGSVSRYLGLLAATLGRWNNSVEHFEDALAMNDRMGLRPWLAHTQRDYARILAARGDPSHRERALDVIEQAHRTYRELNMNSWAEQASELKRALLVGQATEH
jgi:DNA-binding SARP family transcriptional activator